uniref:Uncharacterized protein n=1 Tax=Glossina austeni TaxID=7395 RepID=A0A1A9VP10_GLOAU
MDQLTAFMMLLSQATHDSRTFISKSRSFFSTSCSSKPDKDKTHSELSLLKSALQSSMVTFSNLLLGLLLILMIFAGTATEGMIAILISVSKSSFFGGGGSSPAASGLSTLAAPLLSSCIACGCMATSTSLQFKEARIILSSFFCNSSALSLLSSSSSTLVISDSMSLISSSMPTSVEASSGIFVGRDVLLFLVFNKALKSPAPGPPLSFSVSTSSKEEDYLLMIILFELDALCALALLPDKSLLLLDVDDLSGFMDKFKGVSKSSIVIGAAALALFKVMLPTAIAAAGFKLRFTPAFISVPPVKSCTSLFLLDKL